MFEPVYSEVKAHALRESPNECCGLILRRGDTTTAKPCANQAAEPSKDFVISAEEHHAALVSGELIGYYHSHIGETAQPSPADLSVCEETELPGLIYSIAQDSFCEFEPSGYVAPLIGRNFSFGVFDCFSLVRDYYRQRLGIELSPLNRELKDLRLGIEGLPEYCEQNGLFTVDTYQPHDILLMQLFRAKLPNHCGVFLGTNTFMHQLINQPSKQESLDGYWKDSVVRVLRHQSRL